MRLVSCSTETITVGNADGFVPNNFVCLSHRARWAKVLSSKRKKGYGKGKRKALVFRYPIYYEVLSVDGNDVTIKPHNPFKSRAL